MSIKELINNPEVTIVDVRTPGEFMAENVVGSINIPLDEMMEREDELKALQPMVMCCASGNRSGQAVAYLTANGFDAVYNGGGWADVSALKA